VEVKRSKQNVIKAKEQYSIASFFIYSGFRQPCFSNASVVCGREAQKSKIL